MQPDALLQGPDFVRIALGLRFQPLSFGGKIVAADVEQRLFTIEHMPGQRRRLLVGGRLRGEVVAEIGSVKLGFEPCAPYRHRNELHLQVCIFLLDRDKLHTRRDGGRFALPRPAAKHHQLKRHHAGAELVLARQLDVADHVNRRILADCRRDRQAGNMLRQGIGDPFADFGRTETADGNIADHRIADIAVHIDGIKSRQRGLAVNRHLKHVVCADLIELSGSKCAADTASHENEAGNRHSQPHKTRFGTGSYCHAIPSNLFPRPVRRLLAAQRKCRAEKPPDPPQPVAQRLRRSRYPCAIGR